MKKLGFLLLLLTLATAVLAEVRSVPLLALWKARSGYENVLWMDQRVKLGKDSVVGYIQGTGGADDALMGLTFEEDWDMLVTTIGYKQTTPEGRKAEFFVEAGGEVLFSSGLMESKGGSQEIRVPIRGHERILLRISSDQYNGTAGAAWGEPTLFHGLSDEEMKNDWSISINNRKTQLSGSNAPSDVAVPFSVPLGEEVEYTVKIRRDSESRTIFVEKTPVNSSEK